MRKKNGGRTTHKLSKRCVFCEVISAVHHIQTVTIPSPAVHLTDEDRDYAERLATSVMRDMDALQNLLVDHGLPHP